MPARCSLRLRLPARRAADLNIGGEGKNPKVHSGFQGKENEMKGELKPVALVIRIMINRMDQRKTKRYITNLQDQLATHRSMTAGCPAPYKRCAVWMLKDAEVLPVQNQKQTGPQ